MGNNKLYDKNLLFQLLATLLKKTKEKELPTLPTCFTSSSLYYQYGTDLDDHMRS